MIPVKTLRNGKVAVFGLARSGLDAARALSAGGADVICADDSRPRVVAAEAQGFATADLNDVDWSKLRALVLSPGVPLTHPEPHWTVRRAQAEGVAIVGDTELFFRERAARAPDAPVVAITGTNGKSTTTALVGHLLRAAGREVAVGGNIGAAVLGLDDLDAARHYVLEMSSFQIDLTPTLTPDVGILMNVTPDHLDRHGSMERYAAIKARMLERAGAGVVAVDDDWTRAIAAEARAAGRDVVEVSTTGQVRGIHLDGSRIVDARGSAPVEIADLAGIESLRGAHNAQNAAAAVATCLLLGLPAADIAAGLASFPGLAHRMERVGRLGRVVFVNDSKATNADAAARALDSYDAVYWIAGGRAKEGGIESLRPQFAKIRRAFLIGEAAEGFAATLSGVPHEISGDLAHAVAAAARAASEDDAEQPVVLLAPACASFDQFADFEARGEAFRRLVSGLDGIETFGREAA